VYRSYTCKHSHCFINSLNISFCAVVI
jgi:hypothetical protein